MQLDSQPAVDPARILDWRQLLRGSIAALILGTSAALAAAEQTAQPETDAAVGDVTLMEEFKVSAERIEDFGFRVSPLYYAKRSNLLYRAFTPAVDVLLPNTAAAKAGLRVGDRIVSADGQSTASGSFSIRKWRRLQEEKWAAFAAGKKEVTWVLEVETEGTGEIRKLELRIPTQPPRWGAEVWRRPEGRPPQIVPEPGPLALRAEDVLTNGIGVLLRGSYVKGLGLTLAAGRMFLLGYQWTLWDGDTGHRIFVTRQNGRTEIVLEAISREDRGKFSKNAPASGPDRNLTSATTVFAQDSRAYLTGPDGGLRASCSLPARAANPDAAAEFEREKAFWLQRVSRDHPRWPLVLIPGAKPAEATAAAVEGVGKPTARAAAFEKLRVATEAERALLDDAFAKLGAGEDRWAFTETSRTSEDSREIVVRVDPSRPATERCVLKTIDGRAPTAEEAARWAEEEHEAADLEREYDALRKAVDRSDVRVVAADDGAVLFELPVAQGFPQVSPEKLQAVFRVSRATRAFESAEVKLRESLRLAGVVSVTEAGVAMKFRTLDPARPPQLEQFRSGGSGRVLLKKISQSVVVTRSDFERAEAVAAP